MLLARRREFGLGQSVTQTAMSINSNGQIMMALREFFDSFLIFFLVIQTGLKVNQMIGTIVVRTVFQCTFKMENGTMISVVIIIMACA